MDRKSPQQAALSASAYSGRDVDPSGALRPLSPDDLLDQFRIVRILGRGGMGAVYEAEDTLLRRRVAIKVIPTRAVGAPAGLLREARAAGRLDHPNVLRVHHVSQWEGGYYLVLELIARGSLQDRLAAGPLGWRDASLAVAEACRGLEAIHAAGLVHHDIKPANLMCGESAVKVADFGLVRGGDLTTSAAGLVAGTPYYMSPEQCRGERVDERSDLYSLGATYFHLLTGNPPFQAATPVQVMFAHCNKPLPDIRTLAPSVPAGCGAILQRALAKEPAARFQSAAEMLAALLDVISFTAPENAAIAINPSRAETSEPTISDPRRRAQKSSRAKRPRLSIGTALATMALVGLAALLVAYWLWFIPNRDPSGKTMDAQQYPPIAVGREIELDGAVRALAFSDDGSLLAAGSAKSTEGVMLWNMKTGQPPRRFEWGEIRSLDFTQYKSDYWLMGGGGSGPWFWFGYDDSQSRAVNGWEEHWEPVNAVALKDERAWALSMGASLLVYELNGALLWRYGENEFVGPTVLQTAFAPSPDDYTLAAAFSDGLIRVWDGLTGELRDTVSLGDPKHPPVLAFAPQGELLAVAAGDSVRWWDLHNHEFTDDGVRLPLTPDANERSTIHALKYSNDGRYFATADAAGDVLVWDAPRRTVLHDFRDAGQPPISVAFQPGGRILAVGGAGGTLRLLDLQSVLPEKGNQ